MIVAFDQQEILADDVKAMPSMSKRSLIGHDSIAVSADVA